MGIQLPPELVEVAAKAGVTWPEADEDAMRTSAAAWRDAGNRITGLAGDSDGSATKTLTGITGATGDAARNHWNGVVAPDGDLNTAAKGCHAAADRLEHGADQIGAAKVELVRELVNLAKNSDAAQSAAVAGHPTALLGLDTALAGVTANVTHLTDTLTSSVRLDSGVDVGATSPPVNANPGSHGGGGGLLGTVLAPVTGALPAVVAPVTNVVAGVVPGVVAPVVGALPVVAEVVPAALAPVTNVVTGALPVATHVVPAVPVVAVPVVDLAAGIAPQVLAPVQQAVPDVGQIVTAPAPHPAPPVAPVDFGPAPAVPPVAVPVEVANTTDGTVAQSATVMDRPLLPVEAPAQQAPAQQAPAPPAQAPTQAPGFGSSAPAAPAAPGAAPAAPAAGGAVVGAPQRTDQPVSQRLGGDQQATQQRTGDQAVQQRADQKPAAASQPQAPGSPATSTTPTGKDPKKEETPAPPFAGFVYFGAFSRGANPQPSTRPSRQVEPSEAEVDHGNGLRFAPQDHPHSDLVVTAAARPHATPTALGPDHPMVLNLTDGYDPQAGLHEREWDSRFVRTADPLEHAWPPAAVFPEGGYEAGRPDVLPAGTEVDRFGTPEGRVLAAAGTRFAGRSLPPTDLAAGYRRYVLTQPLPVWRTISAGWFGQPGGGTRYRTTYPVADLVALGHLMELT